MALFIVRHQHPADGCPAQDPFRGAGLLNHLSRPNVRKFGVQIQAEAVVQGEHTMYLIVDAADEIRLRAFMQPFQMAGSLDIYPASTCVRAVASGGCAAPAPEVGSVATLDPEDVCQQAIDAGLVVHRAHPLNGETSIPALLGGIVMPNARFYMRNNFGIPRLDAAAFQLSIGGLVERSQSFTLRDLQNMRSRTLVATLECAGNGRAMFDRPTEGEKWGLGAVSTAEWTGVPLVEILDRAGVRTHAKEVLFRGADGGTVEGRSGSLRFERSLGVDDARDNDVLLAYAMNGESLPVEHGYPLRLIVPRWYAVASVKWLTEIELIDREFIGHYQGDKYRYEWERDGRIVSEPVTLQRVRALITEPSHGAEVPAGELAIRGVAWSGAAPIARVEVSVNGGGWQEARLVSERHRCSWQWWELITRVEKTDGLVIRARATDLAGRTQPERAEWNRLGYGNNAIQEVPIHVT
ncbi:MAG TPA: sulfite oxidase [Vicinamibacterales bacterium]|nr:sulfite oxidase [Vicinamibacterales bacterium]